MAWYNPIMTGLLRSPLHGLISGNTLLLHVTGRKSGRVYTFPVSYVRSQGGSFTVLTLEDRTWWKNLRGGAPVKLLLQGMPYTAQAEAHPPGTPGQTAGIQRIVSAKPAYERVIDPETAVTVHITGLTEVPNA